MAEERIAAWLEHKDITQPLVLSRLKLTRLPDSLPNSLQTLYCDDNQLTRLPDFLPNSLQTLDCYNNQLTRSPDTLPNSLQYLSCYNNQLTRLPDTLPNSLQTLDCYNNQLTRLPDTLPNSLQYLSCHNNHRLFSASIKIKTRFKRAVQKELPDYTKFGKSMWNGWRRRQLRQLLNNEQYLIPVLDLCVAEYTL
jgi:Leucine-rich repeat (LRR) protein